MASVVQICSLALTRLGHNAIISLGDNSKGAKLASLHYEPTRDSVLRAHPWNFAIRRDAIAADTAAPAWGYARAFQLPPDCLRLIALERADAEYRIEGRKIVTDEGGPLKVEYIARVTDPNEFDAVFIDALSARLAAELAVPMTDNAQIMEQMMAAYNAKLSEARTMDAMEGTPRGIDADGWLLARF